MKKVLLAFAALLFLVTPLLVSATIGPEALTKSLISCSGLQDSTLKTCTSLCDLVFTFKNILDFAISAAVLILAPLFFVVGGFLILTGGGNPGRMGTGKKILQGTVISILIVLGSYVLINTLLKGMGVKDGYVGGFLGNQFECQIQEFQKDLDDGKSESGGGKAGGW